jgi:RNA polymerase sigma-70 factor (ECF subfamily)
MADLVASHHAPLYRYAYRLCGSAPDAEDLTQQVFLIAQQKIGQVREASCVRSWLFTVLRNCYLKSRARRLALPIAEFDVGTLPESPPAEPIDSEELQQAIDSLPDDFRLVVLLFYFEHRSYREIADLLDLPLGTVMSRLARAKAHLRRRLSSLNGEPSEGDSRSVQLPHDRPTVIRR